MKEKLHIHGKDLIHLAQKMKWEGDGTSENPFIIRELNHPEVYIKNSNFFLVMIDIDLDFVRLSRSKNIFLRKSKIGTLALIKCSNIRIEDCTLKETNIHKCQESFIGNSVFNSLRFMLSFNFQISDNRITSVYPQLSRGLSFKNNQMVKNGLKESMKKNSILTYLFRFNLLYLLIALILLFTLSIASLDHFHGR